METKMNFCNTPKTEVKLLSETCQPIRELAGYRKRSWGDAIPNPNQLARLASVELESDIDTRFRALRARFGLKRRDLTVDGPVDGAGTISTPAFRYHVNVELDPDDSSQVVWRRAIADVVDAESVFSTSFQGVFNDEFRVLEIQLQGTLDVEEIIDRVEEAREDRIRVDYDRHANWCEITTEVVDLVVHVQKRMIRVISTKGITPRNLVTQYYEIQKQFIPDAAGHSLEVN